MARATSIIREDARLIVEEMGESLQVLSGTSFLVTGAGGFLCSYLVDVVAAFNDSALGPPCHVIAVDNYRSGVPDRLEHVASRPDVRLVEHNVANPLALDEQVDWIVHGASIASPPFYRRMPLETIDVNVGGTRHMLDLARKGARSMLYLSTSEIYGDPDPDSIPTPEDYRGFVSCTGPRACYDESKRLAETLCATYFRLYGTPVKVGRPFNVYGPGQRLDDGRILPDLVSMVLAGKSLVLYSDGRATRSFCYVRDAVRIMLEILLSDANGEAFNIGNDREEIGIGALAELMRDVAAPPVLPIEHHISEDQHYLTDNPKRRCPDLSKLRRLGVREPSVDLEEGLLRTVSSYREQQGR